MSQAELELWGDRFREAGQDAAASSSAEWVAAATAWIWAVPRGRIFTADDLAAAIGEPPSVGSSGAVFTRAQREALVISDGYMRSQRLSNRGRVVAKWRRA